MKIKLPYGTTEENNRLLLPEGMLSVDLEKKALRLHDGVTQGGFEMVGVQAYNPVWKKWNLLSSNLGVSFTGASKLIYGNGIYMVLGAADGLIRTSPDLINWTTRTLLAGATPTSLSGSFIDGYFYVVGSGSGINGRVFRSANGISWNYYSLGHTSNVFSIARLGNRFICSGNSLNYSTSLDGVNWTLLSAGQKPTHTSQYLFVVNGLIFADGATAANGVSYSSDGITWVNFTPLNKSNNVIGGAYRNGRYVFNGFNGAFTATSPTGWSLINPKPVPRAFSVLLHEDKWVLFGGESTTIPRIAISDDGVTWTSLDTSALPALEITAAAVINGKLYFVNRGSQLFVQGWN